MTRRQLLAQAVIPYLDKRGAAVQPGEAPSPPLDLPYVPLGLFGPADAAHPEGGTVFMGVQLAVEDANSRGGKPFRLCARWSDDPWRAGASAVVKLVYTDSALALIGGIDSATTHLAEQVVAKTLVPLIDPVSSDETANAAGVPWIFSWAPGDSLLAAAIARALNSRPYSLLAATDHGSRQLARALVRLAAPAERHDFAPPHVPPPAAQQDVVILAPAESTALIARSLPERARIVAGPSAHARRFRSLCPRTVLAPAPARLEADLASRLQKRFQLSGDAFSRLAYDSTTLLLRCIAEAGTSRAALRDALAPHFNPNGRRAIPSVLIQEVTS